MQNTPVSQRLSQAHQQWKESLKQHAHAMRVAMPGVIQTFDPAMQTVTVQLALKENVIVDGEVMAMEMPILPDVPIIIPRGGGFAVTLPIQQGDECLVIFADSCMDAWWQSGGVQEQLVKRRHSLSDGFAILGPWSQPRVVQSYSATSMQVRSDDGTQVLDLGQTATTLTTPALSMQATAGNIKLTGEVVVMGNAHISSGATGTFSTPTGQVVTVQDGIIISIQ